MAPSSFVVIRVFEESLREVWLFLRFSGVLITILGIIGSTARQYLASPRDDVAISGSITTIDVFF